MKFNSGFHKMSRILIIEHKFQAFGHSLQEENQVLFVNLFIE